MICQWTQNNLETNLFRYRNTKLINFILMTCLYKYINHLQVLNIYTFHMQKHAHACTHTSSTAHCPERKVLKARECTRFIPRNARLPSTVTQHQ